MTPTPVFFLILVLVLVHTFYSVTNPIFLFVELPFLVGKLTKLRRNICNICNETEEQKESKLAKRRKQMPTMRATTQVFA